MTMYTSRLIVIPNYGNRIRLYSSSNSSYTFQGEIFRSTLILLPNSNRRRFIQGIELRCGSFNNNEPPPNARDRIASSSLSSPASTMSDVFSPDESICEYHAPGKVPIVDGESYFDVRNRLLAKSNVFAYTINDDTDDDESNSYSLSIGYSFHRRDSNNNNQRKQLTTMKT